MDPYFQLEKYPTNKLITHIHDYLKTINQFDKYENLHKGCLKNMIRCCKIFPTEKYSALSHKKLLDLSLSRRKLSFILWNSINYCVQIINSNPQIIYTDVIIKLFSQNLDNWHLNNHMIALYPFLKFIGQFTDNGIIYNKCCHIANKMTDPHNSNIISPRQLEHLFAFNVNFRKKTTLVPDKIRFSNRLDEFESCGLSYDYRKDYYVYRDLRHKVAKTILQKIILQTKQIEMTALYYLEASYYFFGKFHSNMKTFMGETLKDIYPKKTDFVGLVELIYQNTTKTSTNDILELVSERINDENKYNNNVVLMFIKDIIDNETDDVSKSTVEKLTVFDEFNLEINIDEKINTRLNLFDRDLYGQNDDEIISIIDNAVKCETDLYFKNNANNFYFISMFKVLYFMKIISTADKHSSYAIQKAEEHKTTWVLNYIKTQS